MIADDDAVTCSGLSLFPAALRGMVTARPEEVLRLMATGLSNPEISISLTVSLETVKTPDRPVPQGPWRG
ncbi:LuxR C-terminal-related transcriptional regulator [Streptomyces sp. NPDC059122]|uniref:LuxR C-terminal-related transcriptional regulator n=1 Tax=Streptomyces sp. NPDC059122 TaxID=3346732 RepID=UPI0036C386F6